MRERGGEMPKKRENTGERKYATAEDFRAKCEEYFAACDEKGLLYGEAGLALHLDVTLAALRSWYEGERCPDLQDAVQKAYLRIQAQIESDPRYQEKGMVTRSIFLQKQKRLGEYQDKVENKSDTTFRFVFGSSMDESDFK